MLDDIFTLELTTPWSATEPEKKKRKFMLKRDSFLYDVKLSYLFLLVVVGCWLLVVGCWLLAVGCWLLVVVVSVCHFVCFYVVVNLAYEWDYRHDVIDTWHTLILRPSLSHRDHTYVWRASIVYHQWYIGLQVFYIWLHNFISRPRFGLYSSKNHVYCVSCGKAPDLLSSFYHQLLYFLSQPFSDSGQFLA